VSLPLTSILRRLWYETCRFPVRLAGVLFWRVRHFGLENVPASGGALIVANHQSHLDPPMIGAGSPRAMHFLARKSLFEFPGFGRLIASINAIPIDREGAGLSGLKESLRRLKRGEILVVFPEGTRSADGEIGRFRPGFTALAVRCGVPIVPAAIEGAYTCWPRARRFPKLGRIHVYYGPPISAQDVERLEERELLAEVESRIRQCRERLRRHPAFARRRGGGSGR